LPRSETNELVLVLAAGRGVRMGVPKALMQVGERPWWLIQHERLAAVGIEDVWIASQDVRDAMRTHAQAPRTIVGNTDAPMFASIVSGVVALAGDAPTALYILPVDVPVCSAETWEALRHAGDHPAVPTHAGQGGHPVRLPWSFVESVILPHAEDQAWIESTRLDQLLQGEAVEVPVDDSTININLNTPRELARWTAEVARSGERTPGVS
jgi:CTP:molybdopterin cytidylyltransferase MocA